MIQNIIRTGLCSLWLQNVFIIQPRMWKKGKGGGGAAIGQNWKNPIKGGGVVNPTPGSVNVCFLNHSFKLLKIQGVNFTALNIWSLRIRGSQIYSLEHLNPQNLIFNLTIAYKSMFQFIFLSADIQSWQMQTRYVWTTRFRGKWEVFCTIHHRCKLFADCYLLQWEKLVPLPR